MSGVDTVVIVGGGQAGASAAFALRKEGFAGGVVLVAEEDEMPYQRPPLSKEYLRGESSLEQAYVNPRPPTKRRASSCCAGVGP